MTSPCCSPARAARRVDRRDHLRRARHLLLVHGDDEVAALQPLVRRIAVGVDGGDDHPARGRRKVGGTAKLGRQRRERQAQRTLRGGGCLALVAVRSGVSAAAQARQLLFGRALADDHLDGLAASGADDLERDPPADGGVGDEEGHGLVGRDRLAVHGDYDVALAQAGAVGGAAGDDRADDLAGVLGQAERGREALVERLEADAEIAALRALAAHQRIDHRTGELGRDGEADPDRGASRRDQRRIDADHIAVEVEHRSARIAHVDGRVGLDVAVVGADAGDPAVERGNDPGGDGATQAIRVADGQDPVADPGAGAVAPADIGQVAALDLEHREVGSGIATDDARRIFAPVGGGDRDAVDGSGAVDALDQMVVGDDVPVGRNDEARAQRAGLAGAALAALPALPLALAALARRDAGVEAAEEFLERVGLRPHRDALLGRDVDHRGLQPSRQIGEGHRGAGAGRHRGGRILGLLRARLPRCERECRSPQKQGHGDPIGVAHFSGLLRDHGYSINWVDTQGANVPLG